MDQVTQVSAKTHYVSKIGTYELGAGKQGGGGRGGWLGEEVALWWTTCSIPTGDDNESRG